MKNINTKRSQLIWGLGVFVLAFFIINIFWNYGYELAGNIKNTQPAVVMEAVEVPLIIKEIPLSPIKLAFVGDIMLDRGVKYFVNKDFGGDYGGLFIKVKSQLQSYDLLFANLEGPVSDRGVDGGSLYSFRFEPRVIPVLKEAGFDIFSLANNHIFNWGKDAFADTLSLLSDANISYVGAGFDGAEAYKHKIINVKGVKIAFLDFSEFKNGAVINSTSTIPGIALISEKAVSGSVFRAKKEADLVIVSYHFGNEYETEANDYQKKYAELAIDNGADLIIGAHPHVVQNMGQYRNVWIAYGLGNFIFDQGFSDATMQGGLLEAEINPSTKKIDKVNLKKVILNKSFQIESIE
jgi:poly-gamma-glutamate capsule biosynthesis protein CapA/YwtB (metallophosphatase superfamily)